MWIETKPTRIVNADRLTAIAYYAEPENSVSYSKPAGTWGNVPHGDGREVLISKENVVTQIEEAISNGITLLHLYKENN